eukprot:jgi/Galph1/4920/GphlegSOOS_G3532.1
MLFEVLYSLVGYPGNVIVKQDTSKYAKKKSETLVFKLTDDFPHISLTERKGIDRICRIGALYSVVYASCSPSRTITNQPKSLYLLALLKSLDEILDEYREQIAKYEEEAVQKKLQTLTFIESELRIWERTLEDLCMLLDNIEEKVKNGPQLIDLLFKFCTSGAPDTASLCLRLLKRCSKVLLTQLETWLYYGQIYDPFNEFFLKTDKQQPEYAQQASVPRIIDDVVIASENLTLILNDQIAKDALFIGGVVRELRKDTTCPEKWEELKELLQGLSCLESHPLRTLPMESTMQLVREWASKQLMNLLFRVAWWTEFEFLRQTFLLGKGDLWFHFMQDFSEKTSLPNFIEDKDKAMNKMLEKALLKTFFEIDSRYERLRFICFQTNSGAKISTRTVSLANGWNNICLQYSPKKPFHVLLSLKSLEQYSIMFCIVFAVSDVRFEMERCWLVMRSKKMALLKERAKTNDILLQLFREVSYVVHCLEQYFQIDLIEELYRNFIQEAKRASDFDQVYRLHGDLVDSLAESFLVYSDSFIQSLNNLLQTFRELCIYIQHPLDYISEDEYIPLQNISSVVRQRIFSFLEALQQHPGHPVMERLFKRLNFNNYYFCESFSTDMESFKVDDE